MEAIAILRQEAAREAGIAEIGGKAIGLAKLGEWGLPVPEWAVIPASAFRSFLEESGISTGISDTLSAINLGDALSIDRAARACRDRILEREVPAGLALALEPLMGQAAWAFRSSAVQEDLEGHSFAGQHSSILNVRGPEQGARAVLKCWASLYNPGAIAYRIERGLSPMGLDMAVIVQRLVPSEKSGVIFTVDPVSGCDTVMLVESSWGLGESVVRGSAQPDLFRWDWMGEALVESRVGRKETLILPRDDGGTEERLVGEAAGRPSLTESELCGLCGLALKAQRMAGAPIDIEWTMLGGEMHLLQCRPATGIRTTCAEGEWTNANFKDGGVASSACAPLMWSLYELVWENVMPEYLLSARMLDSADGLRWGMMRYGRPYWNLGAVKECLLRLPGFVERRFDEDFGIEPAYEGDGRRSRPSLRGLLRGIRVVQALSRLFREELAACRDFRAASIARLERLESIDSDAMEAPEFLAFYGRFIREDYYRSEYGYFHLIFNHSNFQSLNRGVLKGTGADLLALMSGLRGISHIRPNLALWDISRSLRSDPSGLRHWVETDASAIATAILRGEDGPGYEALRTCIREYRHHSARELDILVPRIDEDPAVIVEALKALLTVDDSRDPRLQEAARAAAFESEAGRLSRSLPPWRRWRVAALIARMREFLWWREEYRDLSMRHYYHVRRFTRRLGILLRSMGRIARDEDVFFLKIGEILVLIDGDAAGTDFEAAVEKRRAYYESFRSFKAPDELGRGRGEARSLPARADGIAAPARLRGVPCSPGRASGPARVVAGIEGVGAIRAGDILLTRYTDPGWAPFFGLIAGVATETGGLLSHAAVISREYGLPAIMAVKGLMEAASEADGAVIDGSLGEITLSRRGDAR
jgi:pyruvate,water dikinase